MRAPLRRLRCPSGSRAPNALYTKAIASQPTSDGGLGQPRVFSWAEGIAVLREGVPESTVPVLRISLEAANDV